MKSLTTETFDEAVLASAKPVLVDFYADWCAPCRTVGPIVEQVAGEVGGDAVVAKVDIDAQPDLAAAHGVTSIPTLVFFRDGKEVDRIIGVTDKATLKDRLLALSTTA